MFNMLFKKKKQVSHKQVRHDVYIDTRYLRYLRDAIGISKDACEPYLHCLHATDETLSFQTFRPRLVEVLDAIGDLPASKGLYACFDPGNDGDPDEIKECLDRIHGIDILRCRKKTEGGIFSWETGFSVFVECSHNNAALALFDRLEPVYWINYGVIDNGVIKVILETYPECNAPSFMGIDNMMYASDYFIYSVVYGLDGVEDYYEGIGYSKDAPAALRQLVDHWGIPASLQRPGGP